ncbi:hypothetical protein [Flavobacterium sp. BFFFF1]|nr:hypothetical protein [Flavobacterium sp. BFFFF1]
MNKHARYDQNSKQHLNSRNSRGGRMELPPGSRGLGGGSIGF